MSERIPVVEDQEDNRQIIRANTNADVNWYGTFRGRIEWSSGPILFYGTGGLAYGRVELNSSLNATAGKLHLSASTP